MPPKYINTVPQGVAGTGNATIYGANPVAAQFGNQLAAMRQREYQDELLRRKALEDEAKRTAANWQKNVLKADGGLYWQPEFDKRAHDFIQKGVGLRQAGIDPWGTNPAHAKETMDFLLEKQGLENDFLTRKDKEAAVTEQFKLLKGDPSAFRPASIKALNDYISKPFSEARNQPVPQLQKAYDPEAELYSKVSGKAFTTPTTPRVEYPDPKDPSKDVRVTYRTVLLPETKRLVETTLLGTQDGINYVEDQTGVPLPQLNSIPKTLEEVKKLPEFTWEGNPGLQQQMAQSGVDTKEKAQPILDKMAKEYFRPRQVYDQIVETGVQRATAGVSQIDSRLPDQTRFNQQEKLKADELARQRLAISRQNAANKAAGGGFEQPQDLTLYYGPDGKNAVTAKGLVKFPKAAQNFQGARAYNLGTAVFEEITDPSSKYSTVSIANYPILQRDFKIEGGPLLKKGSPVGNDFADKNPTIVKLEPRILAVGSGQYPENLLIPLNYLPQKMTKQEKAIYDTFRAARQSAPVKSTAKAMGGYKIGQVEAGYEYTGGDPTKQENWRKK